MTDDYEQCCWVYVIEDDPVQRLLYLRILGQLPNIQLTGFDSAEAFLEGWASAQPGVIVLDNLLPGLSGTEFVERHCPVPVDIPILMVSSHATVPLAVEMTRRGVTDVIEKPVDAARLRATVARLVAAEQHARPRRLTLRKLRERLLEVTPREREVLGLLLQGLANKQVAWHLGISPRTVEIHRARAQEKLGVTGLVELLRQLDGSGLFDT
ncbi:MAG: response regulator transcription factor [Myxococcales bacterium]|nr:response regulator transcription factor [Myxococcales bacterium]